MNADTGMINRAVLGGIVFQDPSQMRKLTDIVWPAIARLARARITAVEEMMAQNNVEHSVVVIDAAVLLDAGWDGLCNEVSFGFGMGAVSVGEPGWGNTGLGVLPSIVISYFYMPGNAGGRTPSLIWEY